MQDKAKLIIVDDHSVILNGIRNIVSEIDFIEIAGTANSGREALEILNTKNVDIIITDVEMEDVDGIELTKIVKKEYPHISVMAVTQHSEPWIISKLMEQDIDAIVLKSKTDAEEIQQALQNIKAGSKYYSPEIKELFFQSEIPKNNKPYLTGREKEILTLICKEHTINEIAAKLSISASTVESHRKNLFIKLKVKSQSGMVREAIRHGFYNFG